MVWHGIEWYGIVFSIRIEGFIWIYWGKLNEESQEKILEIYEGNKTKKYWFICNMNIKGKYNKYNKIYKKMLTKTQYNTKKRQ